MAEKVDVEGPEGRRIEVLVGGDPDGFPLLFHSGSPTGAAESPYLEGVARDLGLRIATYSRPGYGGSTPREAPGRMVDDVAESTAVLDRLGMDEYVVLGWSGGGPRALACAARMPGRCRAAAVLAGVAPFDAEGLDWFGGMAEENVAEYSAARQGPEVYEEYVVAEVLPMLGASAEQLAEGLGGLAPPVDRAALTPEHADWLSRSFRAAAAQGPIGTVHDSMAIVAPWGFDLAEIEVPVAIWQGAQDTMVPFAHGEWLAAHVPGATAHLYDEHGHLSLVASMDEIFADLRRLAGL